MSMRGGLRNKMGAASSMLWSTAFKETFSFDRYVSAVLDTPLEEVSLGPGIEIGGIDAGPEENLLACAAFWTGILYDETALQAALEIAMSLGETEMARLREDGPSVGFNARIGTTPVQSVATDILRIAQQGLRRRAVRVDGGSDESIYLEPLFFIVESPQSEAERLVRLFQGAWKGNILALFASNQ